MGLPSEPQWMRWIDVQLRLAIRYSQHSSEECNIYWRTSLSATPVFKFLAITRTKPRCVSRYG
jgi:hypothetical protein